MTKPIPAEQTFMLFKLDKARKRWRFVALLLLFIAVLAVVDRVPTGAVDGGAPYVAHVAVEDVILNEQERLQTLHDLAADEQVQALVVRVDSPGGTMTGGYTLYEALRHVAANKPVVAVMGDTAASAGYMVALGADHILASPATLTGSIGVFLPLVDATELANKIGVKSASVASGELKMVTSPLEKRDEAAQKYLEELVHRMNGMFYALVQERRNPSKATLDVIADGRALVGVQAQELGLVDALGGVRDAQQWLSATYDIEAPLREVDLITPLTFWEEMVGQARSLLKLPQTHFAGLKPAFWAIF